MDGARHPGVPERAAHAVAHRRHHLEYRWPARERGVRRHRRRTHSRQGIRGAVLLHHQYNRLTARQREPQFHVSGAVQLERREPRPDLPAGRANRQRDRHVGDDDDSGSELPSAVHRRVHSQCGPRSRSGVQSERGLHVPP